MPIPAPDTALPPRLGIGITYLAGAPAAMRAARAAGYDNVNIDLIYGADGETIESWDRTVRALAKPFDAAPPDLVLGIEARGFLVAAALAAQRGFVPGMSIRAEGRSFVLRDIDVDL